MSQQDTCLPCQNVTVLNCYPLQCHFCRAVASPIAALHKLGEPLGSGASPPPLCSTEALGRIPSNLRFPRGSLFSLVLPQPRCLPTHHLMLQGPPFSPARKKFPPRPTPSAEVPSSPRIALHPGRAGWSQPGGDARVVRQTHSDVLCVDQHP